MADTSAATRMNAAMRYHHLPSPAIWMLLLALLAAAATAAPTSTSTADRHRCAHKGIAELIRTSPVIVKALAARIFTDAELAEQPLDSASASQSSAFLITLTPETIYKGASLLKMANGAAAAAVADEAGDGNLGNEAASGGTRRSGSVSGSSAWSDSGAAYQYEG